MKKVLLVTLMLMITASVAVADHIGVYSDATGTSCILDPGFNATGTIIHKFSFGATGSRFKMTLPPASSYIAFNTPYVPIGTLITDLSLGYGQCITGSFVIGTALVIYGVGNFGIQAADGFAQIIYTNCLFAELPATGGAATTNPSNPGLCSVAVEPSTWGKVKSLYR